MGRHFKILSLVANEKIFVSDKVVSVSLEGVASKEVIVNDRQLLKTTKFDTFFYLSGGGTYIFKNRYLLVVRRSKKVRVNPGKLSLFTGRAEGASEWHEPWRVVRELFEEVLLFQGSGLLYPQHRRYQEVIDAVYANHVKDRSLHDVPWLVLPIEEVPLGEEMLEVTTSHGVSSFPAFVHINRRNEINVLWLFSTKLNPSVLSVQDSEEAKTEREILFFDLHTNSVARTGDHFPTAFTPVSQSDMTEHLRVMVERAASHFREKLDRDQVLE